jgi:hypothetical protein
MVRTPLALAAAALALATVGSCGRAAETPTSGLAVGARTPPFTVRAVSGPEKGRSLCYI